MDLWRRIEARSRAAGSVLARVAVVVLVVVMPIVDVVLVVVVIDLFIVVVVTAVVVATVPVLPNATGADVAPIKAVLTETGRGAGPRGVMPPVEREARVTVLALVATGLCAGVDADVDVDVDAEACCAG